MKVRFVIAIAAAFIVGSIWLTNQFVNRNVPDCKPSRKLEQVGPLVFLELNNGKSVDEKRLLEQIDSAFCKEDSGEAYKILVMTPGLNAFGRSTLVGVLDEKDSLRFLIAGHTRYDDEIRVLIEKLSGSQIHELINSGYQLSNGQRRYLASKLNLAGERK